MTTIIPLKGGPYDGEKIPSYYGPLLNMNGEKYRRVSVGICRMPVYFKWEPKETPEP